MTSEIRKLRDALENILCMHDGNQSPAMNMPELDYARFIIRQIHNEARKALADYDAYIANGGVSVDPKVLEIARLCTLDEVRSIPTESDGYAMARELMRLNEKLNPPTGEKSDE